MTIQHLPGLKAFLLSLDLEQEFQLVLEDANFITGKKEDIRRAIPGTYNIPGLYFWVMSVRGKRYRIYIGKTKSLVRRVEDYVKEFQAHSPNDYKIHIFQQTILEWESRTRWPRKKSRNRHFLKIRRSTLKKLQRRFCQTLTFCEIIKTRRSKTRFSLYFMASNLKDYTNLENVLIRKYDPILNRRAEVSQAARDLFRIAFEAFYRAGFETALKNDV